MSTIFTTFKPIQTQPVGRINMTNEASTYTIPSNRWGRVVGRVADDFFINGSEILILGRTSSQTRNFGSNLQTNISLPPGAYVITGFLDSNDNSNGEFSRIDINSNSYNFALQQENSGVANYDTNQVYFPQTGNVRMQNQGPSTSRLNIQAIDGATPTNWQFHLGPGETIRGMIGSIELYDFEIVEG